MNIRYHMLAAVIAGVAGSATLASNAFAYEPGQEIPAADAAIVATDGANCTTLLAGKSIDVGEVCLSVFDGNLIMDYSLDGSWYLDEVHAWADSYFDSMPRTKNGNPKIGNFPYQAGTLDVQQYQLEIPLADLGFLTCGVDYYAASHAAVYRVNPDGSIDSETAWGDGLALVARGSWATSYTFQFSCATPEEPQAEDNSGHETAFAKGLLSACFLDFGFNRWGWVNLFEAVEGASASYPLYAGAGKCDINKGTLVGNVSVTFANGQLTVVYEAFEGYHIDEAQLYAGIETFPVSSSGQETVAPGQYTVIQDDLDMATEVTFVIGGLGGQINIIAHATVGGF